MRGGSLQFAGGSRASITNLGTIKTSAGDVALIALNVVNNGKIKAPNGQAILAAGGEVLYVPNGHSDVLIKPAAAPASVDNQGMIAAAKVQLRAAGNAYALAVNNGGMISATTVQDIGGQVVLDGGAGDVVSTGSIVATGAAGPGGTVSLNGGRVAVTGGVDASGRSGGGTISIAAGKAIAVTGTAVLRADATQAGNGGHIAVKSGGATQFDGNASARGGPHGGDGGTAEISGATLGFNGNVNLTAPLGRTGSLLFDPDSITIDSSATPLPAGVISSGIWSYTSNPGAQTVGAGAIVNLLSTSNLTLQANQSITVNAAIVSNTSNFLEFDAPNVAVNANISLLNGMVTFYGATTSIQPPLDSTVTTIGQNLTSASDATIAAGRVFMDGYAQTALAGPLQTSNLFVNQITLAATSFSATNGSNVIGAVQLGDGFGTPDDYSGSFALSTTGPMTVEGMTNAAGGVAITAGGSLTMSAAGVTETQLGSSGGQITLASTGGAFINGVGASLFSGTGRRVIYSSTDGSGYSDGGLGYEVVNPVSYGSDPDSSATDVIYIASSTLLPVLTITANDAAREYGQADPTFSVSYGGGSALDLLTLPQFNILGGPDTNVGSYTIQPYGAVASNYRIVYDTGTLRVNAAPLVITPNLITIYGSNLPTTLPGADFSGLVNGDTPSVLTTQPRLSTSATSGSPVGSYGITASNAAAANYSISYQPGTLTINPAALLITPNLSRDYGASLPSMLPTADFSGLVNGDTPSVLTTPATLNTSATAASGVGAYGITASGAAAADYTISYAPGTLTVNPAPLTIHVTATQNYGGTPSANFTYSGFVNGENSANLTNQPVLFTTTSATTPVGNYSVTSTGAYDPNYQISFAPGTLTINPAPLLITPNLSFNYGGTLPAALPGSDFSGFVNGDGPGNLTTQPTLSTSANSASPVGAYGITASGAALANYTISYHPGTVTVNRAPLVITPNISTVYGSGLPDSLPAADFSGFVNGETQAVLTTQPSLATTANAASPVGGYGITASGASAANYSIAYQPGNVTVSPAPLTIGGIGAQTYGGTPSVRFIYNGLVSGDTPSSLTTPPSYATAATATSQPGAYGLTTFGAADPNYVITYASGVMNVSATPLVVTANSLTRNYGEARTVSLSYSGFVNGDSPFTIFLKAPQPGNDPIGRTPGTYPETILPGILANPGYTVSYQTGTLTVAPAPLVITGNAATMFVGQPVPTLTGTFNGFVLGDTAFNSPYSFAPSVPTSELGAGNVYPINLVGSDPNYAVTYTPGQLTVRGATLTALNQPVVVTSDPLPPLNTGANTNIYTNYNIDPSQIVTVNEPAPLTITVDWAGLGNGAIPEETAIVQQYVDNMAGSSPPVTLASVEAQLAIGGANATPVQAALLPFMYSELKTILGTKQSSWTADQKAFVQGMLNFISEQHQQAAIQAENAYAAWEQQQQEKEESELAPLKSSPAYAYEYAALASNPPMPPDTFLQVAQGGVALTPKQSVLKLAISALASANFKAVAQAEQKKVQSELTWLEANDPSAKQKLAQYQSQLGSSDGTTVADAEVAIDQVYQNASGPPNVAGFSAGEIAEGGEALFSALTVTGGGAVGRGLMGVTRLGGIIFPSSRAAAIIRGVAAGTEVTKLSDAKTAVSTVDDIIEALSEVSNASAVLGPIGLGLELAGNITQAVVGGVEYGQIGTYNKNFTQAVNAANAPVTVADLQTMLNSSTGQAQLMGYMSSAMVIGNALPPVEALSESLTTITSFGF